MISVLFTQTANKEAVTVQRSTVKPCLREKISSTYSNVCPKWWMRSNAKTQINVRARCARNTSIKITFAMDASQIWRMILLIMGEKGLPIVMTNLSTAAWTTSPAKSSSAMARSVWTTIICANRIFVMMRLIFALVARWTQIAKALHKYVTRAHASNLVMLDPSAPPTRTALLVIVRPKSVETTKRTAKSATPTWNAPPISVITRLAEASSGEGPKPPIDLKITCHST